MNNEFCELNIRYVETSSINVWVKLGKDKMVLLKEIQSDPIYLKKFLEVNRETKNFFFVKQSEQLALLKQKIAHVRLSKNPEETVEAISYFANSFFNSLTGSMTQKMAMDGFLMIQNTIKGNCRPFLSQIIETLMTNEQVSSQTFGRSLLCFMMAESKRWEREKNYQNLIISSLLADIGQVLAPELPHPENSIPYLGELAQNNDVVKIIEHHHENYDGSGPLKLSKNYIHPLAKILRLGDAITNLSTGSVLTRIDVLLNEQKNLFDKESLIQLRDYVNRLNRVN